MQGASSPQEGGLVCFLHTEVAQGASRSGWHTLLVAQETVLSTKALLSFGDLSCFTANEI